MKFKKAFYIILGLLFLIFGGHSFYLWWLDSPWREKWKRLIENPDSFNSKMVELKGEVRDPYTIVGTTVSAYILEFENYKYNVISFTGIPEEKSRIIIKGKVKKDFKIETLFENRKFIKTFPWVIIEEERRDL
ncbi:MAG: hypothetical protein N2312_06165 [Dictyoglomaceae bacterium]|nr:hypothetical protein [Dictyoglomaceae bacterium]